MNDSINFQTFSFPQVSPQSPNKLCTLADSLGNKRKYYEFYKLQQMAIQLPRSLSEIIQVIQTGKEETISRLEWTYCVSAKQEWDQENPCLAQETSLKIWELSNSNSWLQGLLLWLLSLSYTETDKIVLADSIKKTFLEFYSHSSNSKNVAVEILVAIAQKNYKKIAKISSQFSVTPEDLLQQNNLASNIPAVKKAENYLVNVFATDLNEHWLLHCFNTMSQEQELKQVEKLLKTIPVKKGETLHSIVQWLQNRYNPRSIHSRWNSLSPEAQSALSNWIGAVNWKQFEKLVDILLRQLDPDDYQYNQLKRRRDFWSNYSDRFQRLRILLPQESANRISQELKQDVDILKEDGSETTEVCIFDFGDIFAIEFFRGAGSEIRLFQGNQNSHLEAKLFTSKQLSLKCLRCLGGIVHDHKYLWQVYGEKLLRDNGIYPNDFIRYFRGVPKKESEYSRYSGLPLPSVDKEEQREKNLRRWKKEIKQLEAEAKDYCRKHSC